MKESAKKLAGAIWFILVAYIFTIAFENLLVKAVGALCWIFCAVMYFISYSVAKLDEKHPFLEAEQTKKRND